MTLQYVFERTPAPSSSPPPLLVSALNGAQRVAAAAWLRERAVATTRTGHPPRAAFTAAVDLAAQLHAALCVVEGAPCPSAASAARTVELDMAGDRGGGDVELGAALAAAPEDAVLACAALVAALVVVVDGPGAPAVIRALTR